MTIEELRDITQSLGLVAGREHGPVVATDQLFDVSVLQRNRIVLKMKSVSRFQANSWFQVRNDSGLTETSVCGNESLTWEIVLNFGSAVVVQSASDQMDVPSLQLTQKIPAARRRNVTTLGSRGRTESTSQSEISQIIRSVSVVFINFFPENPKEILLSKFTWTAVVFRLSSPPVVGGRSFTILGFLCDWTPETSN